MPNPAQGLYKQTTFGKQVALGTPLVGAGGQILRRKTSVFQAMRDTSNIDEIVSHRQDTGVVYGQKKVAGKISALLSAGTYSKFIAAVCMKDFVAGATTGALTNVTAAIGPITFTRAAGSYLTDGFKVGDVVRWAGWATTGTANNTRNFWITSLTATVMGGIFLDGSAGGAKAPGDSVTATVFGKKTFVPLTGHTNDFFTFEEWYSDKSRSELFPDCKVNKLDFGIPAQGPCTIDIDVVGVGTRTLAGAQSFTTPTAETLFGVDQAIQGAIYVNGTVVNHVTSVQLSLDRALTPLGASIGSAVSPDFNHGVVKVSGQFSAMFDDTVVQAIYDSTSKVGINVVAAVDNTATSDFHAFSLGRIAFTNDAPDDGLKGIVRTYPFTAEININGGAGTNADQTIISVQDSQAV